MLYYFKFFCLLPLIILFLFHSVHCAPVENSNRAQIQSGITPPEIVSEMNRVFRSVLYSYRISRPLQFINISFGDYFKRNKYIIYDVSLQIRIRMR